MSRIEAGLILSVCVLFCFPYFKLAEIVGNFGDIYQYAAPFRFFAARSLQAGSVPLWNPSIFAGAPFQASPQSALFYPFTLLFFVLKTAAAFNIFTVAHFFLNAMGMFLLARALKFSKTASLWTCIVWSFSFYLLSKPAAGHVIHLSGYSWTPFVALLGVKFLSGPPRTSPLVLICLAIASASQFFSGHLQVWLYTSLAMLLIMIKRFAATGNGRSKKFLLSLYAAASFTLIAAIQILPTASFLSRSSRTSMEATLPEQNRRQFAASYSMKPDDLKTLIFPNRYGNPVRRNYIDPDHPSVFFETQAIYMGWSALLFSVMGLFLLLWRRKFFAPVIVVFFLLLALGDHGPIYPSIWKILSFQRVPARFFMIVLFFCCLSGAFFFQYFISKKRLWIKAGILTLTLAEIYIAGRVFIWTEDPAPRLGRSQAIDWLQQRQAYFPWRIFTSPEIANPNKLMYFGLSNVNGYEAVLKKSLLEYFLYTQPGADISSTGIDAANDNPAFKLFGAKFFVTAKDHPGRRADFETSQLRIYEQPDAFLPAAAIYRKIELETRRDLFQRLASPLFQPSEQVLAVGVSGGEQFLPKQDAKLIKFERVNGDKLNMTWKNPSLSPFWIFLSESYDPAWTAWSEDGSRLKIFEANGYFQAAVFASAQKQKEKVFWRFYPGEFAAGAFATALAVCAIACAGVWAACRIKKTDWTAA